MLYDLHTNLQAQERQLIGSRVIESLFIPAAPHETRAEPQKQKEKRQKVFCKPDRTRESEAKMEDGSEMVRGRHLPRSFEGEMKACPLQTTMPPSMTDTHGGEKKNTRSLSPSFICLISHYCHPDERRSSDLCWFLRCSGAWTASQRRCCVQLASW